MLEQGVGRSLKYYSIFYKNKYLDYRALAEGLRVQFFWRLAGVPDTVAIHYLRKQKSELDWIRKSMRVAKLLYEAHSREEPADSQADTIDVRYRLIVERWVNNQARYFSAAARRDQRKLEANEHWVRRFFVIRELGEEVLAENCDWVMLHRTRPITVHMGG